MAKIVEGVKLENGIKLNNTVTVKFSLSDLELEILEGFRARTEKWLRKHSAVPFPESEEYTLDDAVMYIVGEVLSGRARYISLEHAFDD